MKRIHDRRGAFTLVELLVVIGIIALLISILLPALAQARRAANTVKCSANIRSILQSMQIYVTQNKGWILGSALTTGAPAMPPAGNANCREVTHINDWNAPIAKIMGIKFNEGPTLPERRERFVFLMNRPEFRCPENDLIVSPLGTPTFPATIIGSYVLAANFLYKHNPLPTGGDAPGYPVGETYTSIAHNPPDGYAPLITKVGDLSRKVYIACGTKRSASTIPPAMPMTLRYDWGGAYADKGPFLNGNGDTSGSTCWDRDFAPGNTRPTVPTAIDGRLYSYRHGKKIQGGVADSFRFTVGFFDGHVEALGDLEGANPAMWNPKGTRVAQDALYPDVLENFYKTTTPTGVVVIP